MPFYVGFFKNIANNVVEVKNMTENTLSNRTKYCEIEQNVLSFKRRILEECRMIITATQLKENLGKYLDLAKEEDVIITKNGKEIARLTSPASQKIAILNSLVGIVDGLENIDYKEERIMSKYESTN